MKTYQVAIIGCGRIAGHNCRAIQSNPGLEIAAVCDLDIEKAGNYGKEFGVPFFQNYHEMMQLTSNIDLVAIITPSGMHYEHALDIMQRYKKHIIVEKPTFMKPSQLIQAYKVAKEGKIKIFPIFQNRYNKAVQRVKAALDNGELGEIRLMGVRLRWCRPQRYYDLAPWRGTFSHDGGALTNQGIHHIDLLRFLGGDVKSVNTTMRTLGADIEVEDSVVATFDYSNNAIGSLEVTTAARPDDFEASLSIVGSKGLAQLGGVAVNELQVFTPDPKTCENNSEDFSGCVYGFGHEKLFKDIYEDLENRATYPVSYEDCLNSIKLLNAFYRSDEKKGWIVASELGESFRLGRQNETISNLYRTSLV
jgi:UDP-N-acetyl-2-amino-2-deoxyglucuronate dehydrogenase